MALSTTFIVFCLLVFSHLNASPSTLQLKDLYTQKYTHIQAQKGKKALVAVFLSARCPCSASHLSELRSLAKQYTDFTFLGIHSNADESLLEAQHYFKKNPLPFRILRDQNSKAANHFKALKTPHAFVIANDGTLLYRGGVTNSSDASRATTHFLNEALTSVRQGKKVLTQHGRTLGCVISR